MSLADRLRAQPREVMTDYDASELDPLWPLLCDVVEEAEYKRDEFGSIDRALTALEEHLDNNKEDK